MKSLFVTKVLSFERSTADKLQEANSETNYSVAFRNFSERGSGFYLNQRGKIIWITQPQGAGGWIFQCSKTKRVNKWFKEILEWKEIKYQQKKEYIGTKLKKMRNWDRLYFRTSYILFVSQAVRSCFNHINKID